MKRVYTWLLISVLLIVIVCTPAAAHRGRTDAHGGHYDRSTGEYHYHHGYGPHQHIDGICPYNFDDQTGENSWGSSSGSNSGSGGYPIERDNTGEAKSKSSGFNVSDLLMVGSFIAVPLAALWIWASIYSAISSRREKKYRTAQEAEAARQMAETAKRLEQALLIKAKKEADEKAEFERMREIYLTHYAGRSALNAACPPPNVCIGPDDLPKELSTKDWGPTFTYYVAPKGSVFHSNKRCHPSATQKVHAVLLAGTRKTPCRKCCPVLPDLAWYRRYKENKGVMEQYKICDFPDD